MIGCVFLFTLAVAGLASEILPPPPSNTGSDYDKIMAVNRRVSSRFGSADKLFEGDILTDPTMRAKIKQMKVRMERHKFSDHKNLFDAINRRTWPNARVPYRLAGTLGQAARNGIRNAIAAYNKETCIRFVPRTSSDTNYVNFMVGGGCYSMIGMQGRGKQDISIGRGCESLGTVIHEMMHAVGFFHEQSRRDRDSYITINWNYIPQGVRYNFQTYRAGEASTLGVSYDKSSVMHYGNYAFSTQRGRMTIRSKSNSNERLGNTYFSQKDITQLNKYYKCSGVVTTTKKPTTCKDRYTKTCACAKRWCSQSSVIRRDCPKTCGQCGGPVNCKDSNSNCAGWASSSQNYCSTNNYVKTNCKKSCRKC